MTRRKWLWYLFCAIALAIVIAILNS